MKRRAFLQSSLAVTALPFVSSSLQAASDDQGRQSLLWMRYVLQNAQQHDLVSQFLSGAALPALGRLGIGPIGVFEDVEPGQDLSIFVLIPLNAGQPLGGLTDRLAEDASFIEAARDYLNTEKNSPAYQRIDSQWMRTFTGCPTVQIPRTGERIFELRVYESHNELKAQLKIEMFNVAELAIFKKVGLDPVFFGETLVGSNLPNLTYMLGYRDMEEHDRAWKAFLEDPDWIALKDQERYRDTVSKIINRFLKPTSYSQI
jgi:hypothetical protein